MTISGRNLRDNRVRQERDSRSGAHGVAAPNDSLIIDPGTRMIDENDLAKLDRGDNYVIFYDYHNLGAQDFRTYIDLARVRIALSNPMS
jgi:hypothetical protein